MPLKFERSNKTLISHTDEDSGTKTTTKTTERIPFRLIITPCCGSMICHVNHRWPSYCSNCGAFIYPDVKGCASINDQNAKLVYDAGK